MLVWFYDYQILKEHMQNPLEKDEFEGWYIFVFKVTTKKLEWDQNLQ